MRTEHPAITRATKSERADIEVPLELLMRLSVMALSRDDSARRELNALRDAAMKPRRD